MFHEQVLQFLAPKAWAPMGRALQDWQASELGEARKVGCLRMGNYMKLHSDVNPFHG